jgi:hypothetical protein
VFIDTLRRIGHQCHNTCSALLSKKFLLTSRVADSGDKFANDINDEGGGKFANSFNRRMPHNSMNAKKKHQSMQGCQHQKGHQHQW